MNLIKKWLKTRESSKLEKIQENVSVCDFLDTIKQEHGSNEKDLFLQSLKPHVPFLIAKTTPEGKALEFTELYLKSPTFKADTLNSLTSNFHRTLMEKSVNEFAQIASKRLQSFTLGDMVDNLSKAVEKKDWNKITRANDPEASLKVDANPHLKDFPSHSAFRQMVSHEDTFKPFKIENGISAKMVHSIDEGNGPEIYMAKPYHKKIESATKSWVKNPILGWSTLATKALFNAGGIGHLAEDVSTHEHEGVPLTVHKFAPNHYSLAQVQNPRVRRSWTINPVDVHKIGVMDYLTNNLDRHHGNIMVGDESNEEGYNPILAIDHERNFQYAKNLRDHWRTKDGYIKESPLSYIKQQATGDLNKLSQGWYSHEDLVDWWDAHGQKMKNELESQVEHIKDEATRNHVRDNFTKRWHRMNNWASKLKNDSESDDKYNINTLHDSFEDVWNSKKEQPRVSSKSLKSLPKNKKDALFAIADIINKKDTITPKQRSLLASAMQETINSMTPQEAGETFRSIVQNPYMSTKNIRKNYELDPRQLMLRHFAEPQGWVNNTPSYKYDHMNEIANAIESLPSEKKEILGHWADRYRNLLAEKERAA